MKRITTTLAAGALTVAAAQAQTTQGIRYLRLSMGNISYAQRSENGSRSISGALYPAAGLFVVDNVLAGAEVPLGYTHYRYRYNFNNIDQRFSTSEVTFGLTPFARYYLRSAGVHRFFGQVSGTLGWMRHRQLATYSGQPTIKHEKTIDYQEYGGGLGYNYFITPGAALELVASYKRSTLGPDRTNGTLDVQAGFTVFLPGAYRPASRPPGGAHVAH